MRKEIGVIVGRFQCPDLHPGHHFLINHAVKMHDNVLVVIGCSPLPLTVRNPMDYETRALMISAAYPNVTVVKLEDCPTNEIWSEKLDGLVEANFASADAILYGSRDSFIPHYRGKHKCITVRAPKSIKELTATNLRNQITAVDSKSFRAGLIYASKMPFPTSYQVVDVAVVHEEKQMVLLGRKKGDNDKYRFIGGFVDPSDSSLERAAKREVSEETSGIETDDYKYLGSSPINDWRYRNSRDSIMSAFFTAKFIYGHPKASDDIDEIAWFPIAEIEQVIIEGHLPLAKMLSAKFGNL